MLFKKSYSYMCIGDNSIRVGCEFRGAIVPGEVDCRIVITHFHIDPFCDRLGHLSKNNPTH